MEDKLLPMQHVTTLHNTNGIQRSSNTASIWSQCCRRIATRTTMLAKSNCLRGSSSGFILRVYSQSLSRKRVFRKAAEVWCRGFLPLERMTYACLTRSFYPGCKQFSLSCSVQFRFCSGSHIGFSSMLIQF